jgi:hypothetical protein
MYLSNTLFYCFSINYSLFFDSAIGGGYGVGQAWYDYCMSLDEPRRKGWYENLTGHPVSSDVVDGVADLGSDVSTVDGVDVDSIAADIQTIVEDATGDIVPSAITDILDDIQDTQQTIDNAQNVVNDPDSDSVDVDEAHKTIDEAKDDLENLVGDLAGAAATLPNVTPEEIIDVLTSAAAEANDGELPQNIDDSAASANQVVDDFNQEFQDSGPDWCSQADELVRQMPDGKRRVSIHIIFCLMLTLYLVMFM